MLGKRIVEWKWFNRDGKKDSTKVYYDGQLYGLSTVYYDGKQVFKLMNYGLHNYLGIYPLSILPNTPFGDPEYIDKYKIKYTKTKALYYHITETEIDESEEENIAIQTATMSFDELLEAHEFRWFIMITHFFGLTQFVSRFLKNYSNISLVS